MPETVLVTGGAGFIGRSVTKELLRRGNRVRALDSLEGDPPRLGKSADAGQIALRATLGYLSLRFAGEWEKGHPRLERWAERFDQRFPQLRDLLPG